MATTRATTTSDEGASAVLSAYGTIAGEGIGRRRVGADAKASAYEEVEGEGARRRDETRREWREWRSDRNATRGWDARVLTRARDG